MESSSRMRPMPRRVDLTRWQSGAGVFGKAQSLLNLLAFLGAVLLN